MLRKKKQQSYDPINLETLNDNVDWIMEDSPPFLTNEEVDALRKPLTTPPINIPRINQIIQPTLEPLPIQCPSNKDCPLNQKGLPHKIRFPHNLNQLETPIPT